jgi:putative membrane protein
MNKDLILRERLALQRTIMANQSTFLAFLRTAMYFLVAGISINQLIEMKDGGVVEYGFMVIAAILLIIGITNYLYHRRKIKQSKQHIGDYKMAYLQEDED